MNGRRNLSAWNSRTPGPERQHNKEQISTKRRTRKVNIKKKSKKIRPMDGWMAGRMDFAEESPTQAKSPQPTALVVKFEPKIQWKIHSFIHSFHFFYFFSTFQNQQIPDFQDQWNVYLQNGLNPISKPQRFIHSHLQINKSNQSLCIFKLSFQLIPIVQCQK